MKQGWFKSAQVRSTTQDAGWRGWSGPHLDDGVDVKERGGVIREGHLQIVVTLLAGLEANPRPEQRVDNFHCDAQDLLRDGVADAINQALQT